MKLKNQIVIFLISVFVTATVFVLIETLVLKKDLKQSIIVGLFAGLCSYIAALIYGNYSKRRASKIH